MSEPLSTAVEESSPSRSGIRIQAHRLGRRAGQRQLLQGVSLEIAPGEVVAIVGGSGAGKTTLLEALAGVSPAQSGSITYDGVSLYDHIDAFRGVLGYVPQDDIIHADLPLRRTLEYAARLRLGTGNDIAEAVDGALGRLGLAQRADTAVGKLSGGQRKRASIAVELLTNPRVFFLDEPTSGLDPATASDLVQTLHDLARGGSSVVFTTHSIQDLSYCDRVVFLAPGGRLAFYGEVDKALQHFGAARIEQIYAQLDTGDAAEAAPGYTDATLPGSDGQDRVSGDSRRPGALRQWRVLTARTAESLARNPLTMAILLGSPVMIVVMFAILFQSGSFDPVNPNPTNIMMILFWVTFGAFFFGITYGLLQIVTERPIVWRENLVGVRLSSYLLAKATVLLPFLLAVVVLMLAVLRTLDRLPAASIGTYVSVGVTMALLAAGALALGLLTSAIVKNASQATLALPLLCFPVVLFSGAILPVHVMAGVGAAISIVIPVRWAFEGLGHQFEVRSLLTNSHSALGAPLVQSYGNAGELASQWYWAYLAVFVVVFLVGAWVALSLTIRRSLR